MAKLPAPQQNTYLAHGPLGGRITARIDSGASLSTGAESMARGLGGLAGGLGALADVVEKQEYQKQTLDAMSEVQGFQDREREMLTQMNEMKGAAGFDAPALMEAFYEKEKSVLNDKAKGDFQRMYYEKSWAAARDQGLNVAFGHRTQELENYKNQLYQGFMDQTLTAAANNPAGWQEAATEQKARFAEMNPGSPQEFLDAKYRAIDAAAMEAAVSSRLDQGDVPGAQDLLNGWRGGGEDSGKGLSVPAAVTPYMGFVNEAAATFGVPENIILGVMKTESGFRADAVSPTGVKGLMQVTQATYTGLGFTGDRADPRNSVMAGAKLLGQLHQQYGNWDDAFAAYNGGPDAVRGLKTGNWGVWAGNAGKQKEIRNYAAAVRRNRDALGGGAPDPELSMGLQKKIDQAKTLYERSAEDGVKAVANDFEMHKIGLLTNGVGLPGYEDRYAAAKARGGLNEDTARQMDMEMAAARDVYTEIASPDGRFKSFAEARKALDDKWNPGPLEGDFTKDYAEKAGAHAAAMKMVAEQEDLFKKQPLDFVAPTAQAEYETMVKEGLVPEGREAITQIEVAQRVAMEKGGFNSLEARQLPALTTGQAAALKKKWDGAKDDEKKQLIAEMETVYGPYFSKALADAKIGAGAITYLSVTDDTADGRLVRDLSLVVDGKKLSDYTIPKEDQDLVKTRVSTLFEDDGPLGLLAEIHRQRGDQTVAEQMSGMKENMTKIAYEMVERGLDADSALKKIGQGFGAGYQTIKDPDLALISFPKTCDSGAVARGLLAIQEAYGGRWGDGFFFRNADDKGVALDTPDGVAAYLTFDQIEAVGGASAPRENNAWARNGQGSPYAGGSMPSGLNYNPYAVEVDASDAKNAATARTDRALALVQTLQPPDQSGPDKSIREKTLARLKAGSKPAAAEPQPAQWVGDPFADEEE